MTYLPAVPIGPREPLLIFIGMGIVQSRPRCFAPRMRPARRSCRTLASETPRTAAASLVVSNRFITAPLWYNHVERGVRDSNPRTAERLPDFQSGAIGHSANPPSNEGPGNVHLYFPWPFSLLLKYNACVSVCQAFWLPIRTSGRDLLCLEIVTSQSKSGK